MPIFEYNCPSCGLIEVLTMPGEKELKLCPDCKEKGKKSKLTKAISASALSFKGSGFYITDYTSKKGTDSSPSTKSEPKNSPADSAKTESPKSAPTESKPATESNKSSSSAKAETKKEKTKSEK